VAGRGDLCGAAGAGQLEGGTSMRGLTGKRVLLTGGGSGIGRATTVRLAQEGAMSASWISMRGAEVTAAQCEGRAIVLPTDITDARRSRPP